MAFLVLACGLAGLVGSTPARAHVGSPDTYAEANAGPYRLLVTVRPPLVIPGVAEIEVRAIGTGPNAPQISNIQIAPIPLTGEASLHPPVADPMKQSAVDKQFFTGALWIMASGSWQVRFTVDGSQGRGVLSIPVPATSSSTRGMQAGLGFLLSVLGLLLVAGVVGIVGAAARDAQLPPGATASAAARQRAMIAMAVALALMIAAVWGGDVWWKGDADDYARYVYKPLTMEATVDQAADGPGQILRLKIKDPGWLKSRKTDDFVLDHDHLMHLYLIREPGLDVVYHLHPDQIAPGEFQLALPSIPAGDYRLYADVVHATGFPETLVSRLTLPETAGRPLAGDDAKGTAQPVNPPSGGATCPATPAAGARFHLSDGYTMVWDNAAPEAAKTPEVFEFSLFGPKGEPASDVALYMGMLGHAAFVKDDGTVFAHVHPSGTVSMTALMMAAAQNQPKGEMTDAMAAMPEMESSDEDEVKPEKMAKRAKNGSAAKSEAVEPATSKLPNTVGFPYGFPTAGAYRIFVQMKHGGTIETAAFDACATAPAGN
jgi:hypothetical protein